MPSNVKKAKLKKGEVLASHSDGVMVMKGNYKKDVSMISIFHDASMVAQQKRGIQIKQTPGCVTDYNQAMGAVDLKDQELQPYFLERKKGTKWYAVCETIPQASQCSSA